MAPAAEVHSCAAHADVPDALELVSNPMLEGVWDGLGKVEPRDLMMAWAYNRDDDDPVIERNLPD